MRTVLLLSIVACAAGCSFGSWGSSGGSDYTYPPYDSYGNDAGAPRKLMEPDFGPTVHADNAPPPISGGTLVVARAGDRAVASDPDRDTISVVDLVSRAVVSTIALEAGAEPGRMAEDRDRRVHVALRRAGALVTIDLETATVVARRAVCIAPRGVAYDAAKDAVHVACAEGKIVTLPAAGGEATRTLDVDSDLRDVVVTSRGLLVTRFRSAELLRLDDAGRVVSRQSPRTPGALVPRAPSVAWRMVPSADTNDSEGVVIVHQRARIDPLPARGTIAYYGTDDRATPTACGGGEAVTTAVTSFGTNGNSREIPMAVLPVDVATQGDRFAVVAAGNARTRDVPQVFVFRMFGKLPLPSAGGSTRTPDCVAESSEVVARVQVRGQPTSAAFLPDGGLLVQTREPAALSRVQVATDADRWSVSLSAVSREDTGHAVFHANSGTGIACASCHAEGGEDGRTWQFDEGVRTPSLLGTLKGTEPYHWRGDVRDVSDLVDVTFQGRMAGPDLGALQRDALRDWLHALPAPRPPRIPDAASARGKAIFESQATGCTRCHEGGRAVYETSLSVGTGGSVQIPPLAGVAWRAPYLHDGCAATLLDRFVTCGGGDEHGHTSQLSLPELEDLVAYLQTL